MVLKIDSEFMDSLFLTIRTGFEKHLQEVSDVYNRPNFGLVDSSECVCNEVSLGDDGCSMMFETEIFEDGMLEVDITLWQVLKLHKDQ